MGVSGASIRFDAALAPIYGIIIGPYLGFISALCGGLITAGSAFDILTSFCPAVSALVAGFLTQKYVGNNGGRIRGWMVAAAVLGVLILGWYFTDIGRKAPFYPVLHIAGLLLIIGTRGWLANVIKQGQTGNEGWYVKTGYLLGGITVMVLAYVFTRPYAADVPILPYLWLPMFLIGGIAIVYSLFGIGKASFVLVVAIASYCGVIADHMLGNLIFIGSMNLFISVSDVPGLPGLFMYMIPVSAAERIMFTVVATILGVGLILAVRRANLLPRRLQV